MSIRTSRIFSVLAVLGFVGVVVGVFINSTVLMMVAGSIAVTFALLQWLPKRKAVNDDSR